VDIYIREACLTEVTWDELRYRANWHVSKYATREELRKACPLVISGDLRIDYDPSKDCFEVKGQRYEVSRLMGLKASDTRYSVYTIG
jgi:hypothetical protein